MLAKPDNVLNLNPVGEVRAVTAGTGINVRLFAAKTPAAPEATFVHVRPASEPGARRALVFVAP